MSFISKKFRLFLIQESLAKSSSQLLALFLPLFLISERSFPVWLALLPILVAQVTYGTLNYFGYKIQRKIGTKPFFIIYILLSLIHNVFLILISAHFWAFWAYVLFMPFVAIISVWQPHQIYLSRYTDENNRGKQMSVLSVITLLASAIGVFFGSWIITYFSFVSLAVIKLFVNALRIIPILKMDNFYEPHMNWTYKQLIQLTFSKRFRKTTISQAIRGTVKQGNFLWPIIIMGSLGSYVGVGSVLSIGILFQIIFFLFIGGYTDKLGRKIMLILGAILNALSWFGRFAIIYLPNKLLLFLGLETYTKFVEETATIPFESVVYDKVDKNLDYRPLFDMMSHVGQISTMFLVVLALALFPALEHNLHFFFIFFGCLMFFVPGICNDEK